MSCVSRILIAQNMRREKAGVGRVEVTLPILLVVSEYQGLGAFTARSYDQHVHDREAGLHVRFKRFDGRKILNSSETSTSPRICPGLDLLTASFQARRFVAAEIGKLNISRRWGERERWR